jgi:hypothetical protein
MNGFKVDFFLPHALHYRKLYYLLLSRRRGIFGMAWQRERGIAARIE